MERERERERGRAARHFSATKPSRRFRIAQVRPVAGEWRTITGRHHHHECDYQTIYLYFGRWACFTGFFGGGSQETSGCMKRPRLGGTGSARTTEECVCCWRCRARHVRKFDMAPWTRLFHGASLCVLSFGFSIYCCCYRFASWQDLGFRREI